MKKLLKIQGDSRNILVLVLGTALAQAIPVALSPVLSRLFTPADFGKIALFLSIVSPLSTIAAGRYEMAVMTARENTEAARVVVLGLLVSTIFCFLLFIVSMLFPGYIAYWLDTGSDFTIYLYFIPLSVLFTTWYQVLNYWLLRQKAFTASSINKIAQTASTGTINLVTGAMSFSKGMLTGDIAGKGIAVSVSIYQCSKKALSLKNISGLRSVAYKFREYPLFNALPAFLDTMSLNLPVLLVGAFYDDAALGFFGLSRLVLGAPLSLISTSINQVYFQKISESRNHQKPVMKEIIKLLVLLTLFFLPVYLVLYFFSESLFVLIFGKEWIMAGTITSIIAITYYFKFVISPLTIVFPALDSIKTGSAWSVLYFIALYAIYYFKAGTFTEFLYLLNYIEICVYLICLALILYTVKKYDQSLERTHS